VLVVVAIAAIVAPRFASGGEGFAAAAGAVLVFLALLLTATIVAIWLAIWTWRRRGTLPAAGLCLGIAPAVLGTASFTALILFLRY
jgi:hypothetical protein